MANKVIIVTGGSGMYGRAIQKVINEENPQDEKWIFLSSKDANLLDKQATEEVFEKYKPTHVLHLAGIVGGLYSNIGQGLQKLHLNMRINDNVLEASKDQKVQKLVSCMSTCIFPEKATFPMDETMMHEGPPHSTVNGYAYAKRMLDVCNHLYYNEHNLHYTGIIPTNIYGPHDNFNLKDSHVLPGLIHKCYLAQKNNTPFVINGSGNPRRQFIYTDDLARLTVWVLRDYPEIDPLLLTVTPEEEVSIGELAKYIAEAFDFQGEIHFDTTKSDGQFKRTTTNKKLKGYRPDFKFTPLAEGIKETVDWFKETYPNVRDFLMIKEKPLVEGN